jgi:hypothetical protein
MPYCSPKNVRILVQTPLSDSQIGTLIEESDAEIDSRIGPQAESSTLVRRLSSLITARMIRSSYPESVQVGEYAESDGGSIRNWSEEIDRLIKLLRRPKTKSSSYGSIDEGERFPEK